MNYLLQSNIRRKGGRRKFLLRLILALLILYILNLLAPSLLGPFGRALARPIWKAEESIKRGFSATFPSVQSKRSLSAENQKLKTALEEAGLSLIEKEFAVAENHELKKMLSFSLPEERTVAAEVLSRPGVSLYDTLIISAGTNRAIEVGDLALSAGGIALGRVARVNGNTSAIKLFSSPKERTDIILPDGSPAAAEGRGGGNFEIRLPREMSVEIGREARLSGFSGKIIGIIESAEADSSDFFQTVRVRTPENIFRINFVKVLVDAPKYESRTE